MDGWMDDGQKVITIAYPEDSSGGLTVVQEQCTFLKLAPILELLKTVILYWYFYKNSSRTVPEQ